MATGSAHPPGDTPARPTASSPKQASAGRYRSDLAPFLASSARPLSGQSRRTPRWCCTTLGEPDPPPTKPTLATLAVGADQEHDHTRVGSGDEAVHPRPAPPGAGRLAPSCVRDRARQGRSGGAGSRGAEEPGPKGDAKQLLSASTVEPVLLTRGGHRTEHGRSVPGSTFVLLESSAPDRSIRGLSSRSFRTSVSARLAVCSVHSRAASLHNPKMPLPSVRYARVVHCHAGVATLSS